MSNNMSFVQTFRYLTESSRLTQESECFMFRSTWSCRTGFFFARLLVLLVSAWLGVVFSSWHLLFRHCLMSNVVLYGFFISFAFSNRLGFVPVMTIQHIEQPINHVQKQQTLRKLQWWYPQLHCWRDGITAIIWHLLHYLKMWFCCLYIFNFMLWNVLTLFADCSHCCLPIVVDCVVKTQNIYQIDYKLKCIVYICFGLMTNAAGTDNKRAHTLTHINICSSLCKLNMFLVT